MANEPLGQMIIELGLDSSTFASGMKGVNQQIKTSMTEMKSHLKVMGSSGSEVDKLKAKQTGLTSVIEAQNKKVALATEEYEACRKEVEGNENATQAQKDALIKAQNELVKATGELGSYENQLKEVTIKLTAMQSSTYQLGESMEKLGGKMVATGDSMAKAGKTLSIASAGIVALGTAAVKTAADFESSMSQVQATMGLTKDSMSELDGQSVNTMDTLSDLAKQMGAETKFTASEAAAAINNLAMAGYDVQQIYDALPRVLALASAGNLDLDYACQLAANGLNSMSLEVSDLTELSDKMAVTASSAYGS
ncbi:MAG: phage tail tape measure protein, partial [Lachnospiraceae bacterium]